MPPVLGEHLLDTTLRGASLCFATAYYDASQFLVHDEVIDHFARLARARDDHLIYICPYMTQCCTYSLTHTRTQTLPAFRGGDHTYRSCFSSSFLYILAVLVPEEFSCVFGLPVFVSCFSLLQSHDALPPATLHSNLAFIY